jgi:ATP-dependent Clp protease ATP-binding subunit ClpA
MDRPELERRVTDAVRRHFVEKLERPELLNRIGDNIVVFNFITPEAANEIFEHQLRRILARVERHDATRIRVLDEVREQLRGLVTADPSFGGRGIGSFLETSFVNPLARGLFAQGADAPTRQVVTEVARSGAEWVLSLRPDEEPGSGG